MPLDSPEPTGRNAFVVAYLTTAVAEPRTWARTSRERIYVDGLVIGNAYHLAEVSFDGVRYVVIVEV